MASTESFSYGGFIPLIQSVQELAKEPMAAVPHPFLLDVQDLPIQPPKSSSATTIPTIDMKHLITTETTDCELQKLHSTCKEWGLFQAKEQEYGMTNTIKQIIFDPDHLVNHGVGSSLMKKLKSEIGEFYQLPLEEKMKYKLRPGDVEGYGLSLIRSEDQKLDWGDRFYMITNPVHRRKPHLLPELPPSLRDALECYLSEMQKVAMTLLGFIAKALKLEEGEIEASVDDGMQAVRMTYYPPCPRPDLVMGLTPHSDATVITILLQVNGVDGLQIKKDGFWLPVSFLPDALVVNVGDVLEIISNGLYTSIEHRATVNSERERISMAMFFNPKFSAEIGPATSLINPQNPPLFRRVGMQKYFQDFFARKLDGKSFLERMKIKQAEDNSI